MLESLDVGAIEDEDKPAPKVSYPLYEVITSSNHHQAVIREFFENTTIHGLAYLSTAHHCSKLFWFLVVASAIAFEAFLIHSSFLDWETDPVATMINALFLLLLLLLILIITRLAQL